MVLAGGWFLLVSPQRANVASLNEQTTTQEQTNAALQTKITALKAELVQLPEARHSSRPLPDGCRRTWPR